MHKIRFFSHFTLLCRVASVVHIFFLCRDMHNFPSFQAVYRLRICQQHQLPRYSTSSFIVAPIVFRLFRTMNSGTGSTCVCNMTGRRKSARAHFSCPPSVLIHFNPFDSRKPRNRRAEILDSRPIANLRNSGNTDRCRHFFEIFRVHNFPQRLVLLQQPAEYRSGKLPSAPYLPAKRLQLFN